MAKVDLTKGIHPALDYSGSTCRVGAGFAITKTGTFGPTSVGMGAQNLVQVWATPTKAYAILGAAITITGTCTSSTGLASPALYLSVFNGAGGTTEHQLLADTMTSWGGTSYTIDASTGNKAVFSTHASGGLLDNSLSGNQQDQYGAHSVNGMFVVTKTGSGAPTFRSFLNKAVWLRIDHGFAGSATLTIPYRVDIFGFLLGDAV